jgi:hypothetical protein
VVVNDEDTTLGGKGNWSCPAGMGKEKGKSV